MTRNVKRYLVAYRASQQLVQALDHCKKEMNEAYLTMTGGQLGECQRLKEEKYASLPWAEVGVKRLLKVLL